MTQPGQVRKFPRVPASNPVLVRRATETDSGHFAKARTLGGGGCRFDSKEPFEQGAALWLTIAAGDGFIEAPAQVVYAHKGEGGAWEVGVEFLNLSPMDREALDEILAGAEG